MSFETRGAGGFINGSALFMAEILMPAYKPQDQRYHDADKEHTGQGDVYFYVRPGDDDISGKPAQGEFSDPWP